MTNEQAIELLMSVKWNANIDEQEDKALSMAIEALEKHGDEPVGCYGCVHERHGNQVCDACSRSCLDRYVGGDSDDNTESY